MKTDTEKTTVQFFIEPDGDVVAYFPNMKSSGIHKTCYAHIGQHSACSPDYVKELKPATRKQYKDLKEELESIGYKLSIH